ncbi:MAG: DUF3854 domain-containing protein [Parasporobacterium sp.]|nr:DUF3854 domain-containing protein [Parasporobacterium sp.]
METGHQMPFGIGFVTDLLGLSQGTGAADRESFYTACPFCQRKRKLNINLKKDAWHCPACGEGGGMIKLYAMCREISQKEAARELFRIYHDTDEKTRKEVSVRKSVLADLPEKRSAADLKKRNAAYQSLLAVLPLSDVHREALHRRGLSDDVIDRLGYRSTPQHGLGRIAAALEERGVDLDRIPGFYGTTKKRMVYRTPGILLPVRTLRGQISGLQIRYDSLPETASEKEKEVYRKYAWFYSGDKKTGTSVSGCENIHHAGFHQGASVRKVCLTEGVLKADIASAFSRVPFLGLTGVCNTAQLKSGLEDLKRRGTESVYVCVDMDWQTNRNVERALARIAGICQSSGLETTVLTWPGTYKGIDDFLLEKKRRGML